MKNNFISSQGLSFSLPYILLVFFIPSIDYLRRLEFLNFGLNFFEIFTREPIFLLELYILDILIGDNSIFIARIINIYLCIIFILILVNKDQLSNLNKIIIIYNPISFFLIFNINAQLLATLSIYWVARDFKNSGFHAAIAPFFHFIGLAAVFVFFLKKSAYLFLIFLAGLSLIFALNIDYFLDLFDFIYQFYNFILNKFNVYINYQINQMHSFLSFLLIFVSLVIVVIKRRINYRYLFLFISVLSLSFLSLDYKFFSRIIFSFEFLLIYEMILCTKIKYEQ